MSGVDKIQARLNEAADKKLRDFIKPFFAEVRQAAKKVRVQYPEAKIANVDLPYIDIETDAFLAKVGSVLP